MKIKIVYSISGGWKKVFSHHHADIFRIWFLTSPDYFVFVYILIFPGVFLWCILFDKMVKPLFNFAFCSLKKIDLIWVRAFNCSWSLSSLFSDLCCHFVVPVLFSCQPFRTRSTDLSAEFNSYFISLHSSIQLLMPRRCSTRHTISFMVIPYLVYDNNRHINNVQSFVYKLNLCSLSIHV